MGPRRITFVGIGAIGLPMAEQLHRARFEVTAVDPVQDARTRAVERGLRAEPTPESVARADVVVCMVATPDQLRALALGTSGVLARMPAGSVLVVMSTVGPETVSEVVRAAPSGVGVLDVPVTGGVARARTGELTLFASGDPAVRERLQPVLAALGRPVDCGPEPGGGQAYKAVNQLLCSVHIVAAAEALALAERLGLDPAAVLPAVAGGAGGSWMLSDRGPRMLQGLDAEVTSTIGIFVKDSTLVAEVADAAGMDVPLLRAAQTRYLTARAAGWDRADDSQVIQTYRPG